MFFSRQHRTSWMVGSILFLILCVVAVAHPLLALLILAAVVSILVALSVQHRRRGRQAREEFRRTWGY